MQYKTFIIPANGNEKSEAELNVFLRTNKIISIAKQFVSSGVETAVWCFLVEYIESSPSFKSQTGTKKIDYMQILSHEDFAVFSKLREWRKITAQNEKIPAYAVFTDEQLYKIVKASPKTQNEIAKIEGIGQAKAEKYGNQVLSVLQAENSKHPQTQDGKSIGADNENKGSTREIPF